MNTQKWFRDQPDPLVRVEVGVTRIQARGPCIQIGYVNTDENLADLLTKPLSGPKRAKFVRMVLHHVFPEKGNGDMGGD
jgi:hypothetical protein